MAITFEMDTFKKKPKIFIAIKTHIYNIIKKGKTQTDVVNCDSLTYLCLLVFVRRLLMSTQNQKISKPVLQPDSGVLHI